MASAILTLVLAWAASLRESVVEFAACKRRTYRMWFEWSYGRTDAAVTDADGDDLPARAVAAQALSDRALAIVTLGLVAVVGVLAFAEVEGALPAISNADLSNSRDNLTADFGSAIELMGPVMIVVVAALILRVVRGF